MSLAENVLQQIAVMRQMSQHPSVLRADTDSLDCLLREVLSDGPTMFPTSVDSETRIYGLRIEITADPNFEVV
jgi:hypothetical protein